MATVDMNTNPILKPLNNIVCRDAVLNPDGTRAEWPEADVVVGNPPFLGNKRMIDSLGEAYTAMLRSAWPQVPGGVDLVAYWFVKAGEMIQANRLKRAGLVATNSIRGGVGREVLKPIVDVGGIFDAWGDQRWVVDGAAVRVSILSFGRAFVGKPRLDGRVAAMIGSDLSEVT